VSPWSASRPGQLHLAQQIVDVANTQVNLEALRNLGGQRPSCPRFVLSLALVQPLAECGVRLLGMTVAPINQSFPGPSAGPIPGLEFGHFLRLDAQSQVSTYLAEGLACLKAQQQAFQTLGLLAYGWGMDHQNLLERGDVDGGPSLPQPGPAVNYSYAIVKVRSKVMLEVRAFHVLRFTFSEEEWL